MSKSNYYLTQEEIQEDQSESMDYLVAQPEPETYASYDRKSICVSRKHDSYVESNYLKVHFETLERVTKEGRMYEGAILLLLVQPKVSNAKRCWFPKSLCVNLDLDAKTVWIRKNFINNKKIRIV